MSAHMMGNWGRSALVNGFNTKSATGIRAKHLCYRPQTIMAMIPQHRKPNGAELQLKVVEKHNGALGRNLEKPRHLLDRTPGHIHEPLRDRKHHPVAG